MRNDKNMKSYSNVQQSNQQKSNPSMKYKLHRKLTSTKSAPTSPHGQPSSSKTTVQAKPPLMSHNLVAKTTSLGQLSIKDQPATLRQPNSNSKWIKNDKTEKIQGLKSSGTSKMLLPSHKASTKHPPTNPYQLRKSHSITRHFSNADSSTAYIASTSKVDRTVVLPNSGKPLAKASSLSVLSSSSSNSNSSSTVNERSVVLPKSGKPLAKALSLRVLPSFTNDLKSSSSTVNQRAAALPKSIKPLAKTISLPAGTTRDTGMLSSLPSQSSSSTRVIHFPKNHRPISRIIFNPHGNVQRSTSLDYRTIHLPKTKNTHSKVLNNTSNNITPPTTSLHQKITALPKSHQISPRGLSVNKSRIPNTTVSKGAKLKWRRKSASELRTDSSGKNLRSQNSLGNAQQTRIALKSRWPRTKARPSCTLRKTSMSRINNLNAKVVRSPKNEKGKVVIRSSYTKSICQSRNIPKRSRLKWSKILSQSNLSTESNGAAVRSKPRFLHKSRFCLRRRKSSEGKVYAMGGSFVQGINRVPPKTGLIRKIKPQNKGFFARLVE